MKIYYGWYIVVICMLVLMLALGATTYAYGLFVLPVADEFGLSRANVNTGIILLNFGMALSAPFIGRLLDHRSIRQVMAASALLFGASFVGLGLSQSVWLSAFLLAVPVPIAVVSAGTLTSPTLVARWFSARRGRAMAFTAIGISLGSIVTVPLISLLLAARGWRETLVWTGVILAGVILCLVLLVREKPETEGDEVDTVHDVETALSPMSVSELLRKSQFWTIAVGAGLGFGVLQAIVVSLVPFAQGRGLSVAAAAGLISLYGGMAIVGKLVLAWIADRTNLIVLLAVLFGLVASICVALMVDSGHAALIISSALLGLAAGATTPAFLAILADRFGTASFGTTNGCATFVLALISAACIRYSGEVYDRFGDYKLMFLSFSIMSAVALVLLLMTRRTPRADRE